MPALSKNESALLELFHSGTRLSYKKGEYIIRPGESPSGVFFIESGIVKAYDITKYGEENLLIVRRKNEVFPLIWAITGQERHIIYEALCDTVTWRIDREELDRLIDKEPGVLEPLLEMTVEMYRVHSERIITLEYRTVRERMISFLLSMVTRFGVKQKDGSTLIDVPLRHGDIASSINTSRETASRELKWLENQKLISTNGLITLRDIKKLKKFL